MDFIINGMNPSMMGIFWTEPEGIYLLENKVLNTNQSEIEKNTWELAQLEKYKDIPEYKGLAADANNAIKRYSKFF